MNYLDNNCRFEKIVKLWFLIDDPLQWMGCRSFTKMYSVDATKVLWDGTKLHLIPALSDDYDH